MIAEARAGLFPDAQFRSHRSRARPVRRSRPTWTRRSREVGRSTSGARSAGRSSSTARRRKSARPISTTRRCRSSRRSRSPMCRCARPTNCTICSLDTVKQYQRSLDITQEPVQRRHDREIGRHHGAGASARRAGVGDQHRRRAQAERARDRGADGQAARGGFGLASPPAGQRAASAGEAALDAAGAPARYRRGRAHDEGAERRDRRGDRRLLSRHLAERRLWLCRRSLHQADRRGQSGVVVRAVDRADAVRRRADGGRGRGGEGDLRGRALRPTGRRC